MLNFIPKFSSKKRMLFLAAMVLIAAGLFLLWPEKTYAVDQGVVVSFLSWVVIGLVNFLATSILLPLMNLVVELAQYNGFLGSYAVSIGWPLVRDVANMFFVVVLLIIAFGTILGISSYHYKATLLKLVIMAILINFSKTITGFLIDFSQVIMLTFVDAFRGAAISAMSHSFGLSDMLTIEVPAEGDTVDNWEIFGSLMLGLVFIVVASGTMLAYVVVLLYRIISLWVLVLLSPFAFFAAAFPALKKYSSEFWSKFFQQLSVGIALAFFMWLSFMILAANFNTGTKDINSIGITQSAVQATGVVRQWDRFYTFIVAIALMLLALQYAQQAGGFAGSFAGKVSGSLSQFGSKALKKVASTLPFVKADEKSLIGKAKKRIGGYLERKMLLEPAVHHKGLGWLKYATKSGREGYFKKGDNLLDESRTAVSSKAYDEANKRYGLKTGTYEAHEEKIAKQRAEELHITGLEGLKVAMSQAIGMKKGVERDRVIRGIFEVASKAAWVDDLMQVEAVLAEIMDPEEFEHYKNLKGGLDSGKKEIGEKANLNAEAKAVEELIVKEVNKETGLTEEQKTEKVQEQMKGALDNKGMVDRGKLDDLKTKLSADYNIDFKVMVENRMNEAGVQASIAEDIKEKLTKFNKENEEAIGKMNYINRKKTGKFLEKFIATDYRGNQSQVGLEAIYNHEKNAISNGHLEDVGYARVDEDTGKMRMLDYTKLDKDGLTEADRMGLSEINKLDPTTVARAQAHSIGARNFDGTQSAGGEYYSRVFQTIARSNEAYRINMLMRTAFEAMGGSSLKSPSGNDNGKDFSESIYLDTVEGLKKVLWSFATGPNAAKVSYDKTGAKFLKNGTTGEVHDSKRDGMAKGFSIINFKDKDDVLGEGKDKDHTFAIGPQGQMYKAKKELEDDKFVYKFDTVGGKIASSIIDFANNKMLDIGIRADQVNAQATEKETTTTQTTSESVEKTQQESTEKTEKMIIDNTIKDKLSKKAKLEEELKAFKENPYNVKAGAKEKTEAELVNVNNELNNLQTNSNNLGVELENQQLIAAIASLENAIKASINETMTRGLEQQKEEKTQQLVNNQISLAINKTKNSSKLPQNWMEDNKDMLLFTEILKKELFRVAKVDKTSFKLLEEELKKNFTNLDGGIIDDQEMNNFLNKYSKK